jgi:hypothetical protein
MSARSAIPEAYVAKLKEVLVGHSGFNTNIYDNVYSKVMHFKDIQNFPTVTVTPGPEQRQDMPSNFTLCNLEVAVRIYVSDQDDSQGKLETIIGDLEKFFDNNLNIEYNLSNSTGTLTTRRTISNTILSITTDEGILAPLGVGEILLSVEYEKIR